MAMPYFYVGVELCFEALLCLGLLTSIYMKFVLNSALLVSGSYSIK